MFSLQNLSKDELISRIKEGQFLRRAKNYEIIKDSLKSFCDIKTLKEEIPKLEQIIVYLISLSISVEYIAKLLKIERSKICEIAKQRKITIVNSMNQTYNPKNRSFAKPQLITACEQYNFICPSCFNPLNLENMENITGHHIIPYSRGGLTLTENCLPLHIDCHYENFQELHQYIFNTENVLLTAQYFNQLKQKLQLRRSGLVPLLYKKFKKIIT
jgi:5-methylcytosine-specific restriction endonuclease McrA